MSKGDRILSIGTTFRYISELHERNVESMKETESSLKSKLKKSESDVSELSSVRTDLKKLRNEFDILSKNHLRITDDLNR